MHEFIPARTNRYLAMVFIAVNLWQFLFLPLLLWTGLLSAHWLWTLVPCALTSNPTWFLIHEAFHHGLAPDKDENSAWGRALALSFGGPYELLRFGHMMHHRFNGAVSDRPDLYDPAKTSRPKAWISYYFQLLGGFYLSESLSFFVFFLSQERISRFIDSMFDADDEVEVEVARVARRTFLNPSLRIVLQRDGLAVWASLLISLLLYSRAGFWYVPLLILAVRALSVSLGNNLPHYGTEPDDVKYGQNSRLPRFLSLLVLNSNYHRTHHHHANLPWTLLPEQLEKDEDTLDAPYLSNLLAQFKGPSPMEAPKP